MSVFAALYRQRQLVAQSGQMRMDKVGRRRWTGALAQARLVLMAAVFLDIPCRNRA